MTTPEGLLFSRCSDCHTLYLPRPGPCPKCGGASATPTRLPPVGRVLAATELSNPPAGWSTPHRLALVELPESARLLVVVRGELPPLGALVPVTRDGEVYVATVAPAGG